MSRKIEGFSDQERSIRGEGGLLSWIVENLNQGKRYEEIMASANKKYNIGCYKIMSLTPKKVVDFYSYLKNKYLDQNSEFM